MRSFLLKARLKACKSSFGNQVIVSKTYFVSMSGFLRRAPPNYLFLKTGFKQTISSPFVSTTQIETWSYWALGVFRPKVWCYCLTKVFVSKIKAAIYLAKYLFLPRPEMSLTNVQIFGDANSKYLWCCYWPQLGLSKYSAKPSPNICENPNWVSDQLCPMEVLARRSVVPSSCQTNCFSAADNVSVIKGLPRK